MPRLLMGVLTFALMLPLLLVACGGADEPTVEPYSGQTTNPEPLMVQTSPETERETLSAFYNTTESAS